jgi:rhodanese-related sulfurtransferase
LSCAIAPIELAHQLQSPGTVLIDTRSAAEFANFHIDGAMNISATELRNKAFLHEKSIVLIGNGKAEREQYIDCKRLKSNGFKQLKVLRGGLPNWLASEQGILGQAHNPAQLTKLTPSELWIESQFEANLILVTADQAMLQKQIVGSMLMPDEKPKTIQSAIKQRSNRSQSGSLAAVVVIATKNFDFQGVSHAIKPVPLLVYTEKVDAFTDQVRQQNAVWATQLRGPKQPSGCVR